MRHDKTSMMQSALAGFLSCILLFPTVGLPQESGKSDSSKTDSKADGLSDHVGTVRLEGVWSWESFGGRTRELHVHSDEGGLKGLHRSPSRRNPEEWDESDCENLQVTGDKVSFEVTRTFGDSQFVTRFVGVVSGDEIAGVQAFNFGGQTRESAWLAKRIAKKTQLVAMKAEAPSAQTADESGETESAQADRGETDTTETESGEGNAPSGEIPQPMRIPSPGEATEGVYQPQAILPGGIVMPLYPPDSPHLNQDRIGEPEKYNLSGSVHGRINSIVNIHNPSIEVHFASPGMNTGAVVILAAGGGHRTLNVGTESADFVPFFYNYGVNTVILRNRLRSDGYEPSQDAVRDAMQAIRLVRKHAEQWKFDPQRIGIMGFSAGAELSAPAAVQFKNFDEENSEANDPLAGVSSRPDFVGVIYPGPSPFTREPETEVPRNAPPSFIASPGSGDWIHAVWATDYFSAMLKARIPNVEMHIYGNGFHPGDRGATGGLTYRKGIPFGSWQQRFIEWFEDLGFLAEPGVETKAARDSAEFVSQPPRQNRRGPGRQRGPGNN